MGFFFFFVVLLLSSARDRFLPGGMRTNANQVETSEELQAFLSLLSLYVAV